MWGSIAKFILRQKVVILLFLGVFAAFMAYQSQGVRLQYGLPKMLPDDDSTIVEYQRFRTLFGKESIVIIAGIKQDPFERLALFNAWYDLNQDIKSIDGVDTLVSATSVYNLVKNSKDKKFELMPVVTGKLSNEKELDSVKNIIYSLPFYEGVLFNTKTNASIMAISLNRSVFNSEGRTELINEILAQTEAFQEQQNIKVHYSGLPYIRTVITELVKKELRMFIILAVLVTVLILYFFFRSLKPIAISMLVVALGVVCSLGTMALLDYEITILTAIIPPLIIVIGIPNCIFLINKYHSEFKNHGNKAKALTRVIQKIGRATFMTNATTATGFITFIFTSSTVLVEFGVIAALSIMYLFLFSITIIPSVYSYLAAPKPKHTNHLEYVWMVTFVNHLATIVKGHRTKVYWVTAGLVIFSLIGMWQIKATGNLVDDLPRNHTVTKDLQFFEENFAGVMPFNIAVEAENPRDILKYSTLRRLEKLQDLLASYPEFSKPVSVVDGIKFSRQAFYGGNPKKYALIGNRERAFFKPYIDNAEGNKEFLKTFMDTSFQHARVNVQIADIGTYEMDSLLTDLEPKIAEILPPDKFKVTLTGSSIVYLAGTKYLVKNLFISLLIAVFIVGLIMAMLFSSLRMIAISIATNLIPLLLTAGMMGYFDIYIKPSTILVFSIAFGISVDDTIHFLAKFRQELKLKQMNIGDAVLMALRETGVSMIYTSIILFFGFSVFDSSEFGGTQALGILVSFTLLIAMLANLVFLPSLLLTLEKRILTRAFNEPMMDIYDEEEDIELDELEVDKGNFNIQK